MSWIISRSNLSLFMSIIIGIGVDIEVISRFRDLPFNENKSFYGKIFTKGEIEYCIRYKNPYPHFAVRFCAKEAAVKALGKAVDLKKIEVQRKSKSAWLRIDGRANLRAHVSLTHTKEHAIAFVILTKDKK